jgi:hypothetical protein
LIIKAAAASSSSSSCHGRACVMMMMKLVEKFSLATQKKKSKQTTRKDLFSCLTYFCNKEYFSFRSSYKISLFVKLACEALLLFCELCCGIVSQELF